MWIVKIFLSCYCGGELFVLLVVYVFARRRDEVFV